MKKYKTAFLIFFLSSYVLSGDAQPVPAFESAPHCIFLNSVQHLNVALAYYRQAGPEEIMNLGRILGYSIDENISKVDGGRKCIKATFYRNSSDNNQTPMIINLCFEKMLDTINYYLLYPNLYRVRVSM